MYSIPYLSAAIPYLVIVTFALGLHGLSRLFLLSTRRRSRCLFGHSPWLPLRSILQRLDGEKVEFINDEMITLRGVFLPNLGGGQKGTILFCHELNGNASNIAPYVKTLTSSGFNILAFDFQNHGQSDASPRRQSTPWVTTADMDDVQSALNYLRSRQDVDPNEISVFGLGKGATIALCLAGLDKKVKSVVLDAPVSDNRLYQRNCWQALVKSLKISRRSSSKFFSLFLKAILYSISCPFVALALAWHRFVLGFWFDCRFVNPWPLVKKVNQPIMIVHGYADSNIRPEQIQAFCDHMLTRPRLWFASVNDQGTGNLVSEDCCGKVAQFLRETM